ncbi:MAG: TPM domain-containing protein, partial [Bacteroidetes bacterium]|nr:TPM domain-containing protein [Bacteroidota bacterium]
MIRLLRMLTVLVGFLLVSSSALAQRIQVIEPTGQWVTDRGDFFSSTEERTLTHKLSTYADTTSTQIIVVTLPDLGGYEAAEYAVQLGRDWGVGQQGQDNGLVILLSKRDRQVFIATGYGLEGAVTDALAGDIVRNVMLPHFRQGAFFEGVSTAIDFLIMGAAGEFDRLAESDEERIPATVLFNIFLVMVFVLYSIVANKRRGGGKGGKKYTHGNSILPILFWSSLAG